jgi:hypothetical protein
MTYTITQDNEVLQSGETEIVVVAQSTGGTSEAISIAIDYTGYFARIATALETIAEQITPLIADGNGERFADQLARLRYLADPELDDDSSSKYAGSGIRTSQPYSPVLNAILYKDLILEGNILRMADTQVTDENADDISKQFDEVIANGNKVRPLAERRIQDLLDSLQQFNRFK